MLRQILHQTKDMAHLPSTTDLARLIQGYRLCARTEGKSEKTMAIVVNSVTYLERFLRAEEPVITF